MTRTDVLIVGASVAGIEVAHQLARRAPDTRVTVVSREDRAPYDRPPLSKQMLLDPAAGTRPLIDGDPAFRLVRGDAVSAVDYAERIATLASGARVAYTTLILATGAIARRPTWAVGTDVLTLRDADDAAAINRRARTATHAVIVGGGLVGAEVAASLREHGTQVTLVHAHTHLSHHALGADLAGELTALHRRRGVEVIGGRTVVGARQDGERTHLTLDDGRELTANLVVAAVGASPEAGIGPHPGVGGPIRCDAHGRALGVDGVYALGDVSAWTDPDTGQVRAHQHWTNAVDQARVLVSTLLGEDVAPFRPTGYVWSDQFGVRFERVGVVATGLRTARRPAGDAELTVYLDADDRIVGAAAANGGRPFAAIRKQLRLGPVPAEPANA